MLICDECKGAGGWASRQDDPEPPTECLKCGGTGKLPPLTKGDDGIKKFQIINWFPEWQGFMRWHYPRTWSKPMFYGFCFLFLELRYFPYRKPMK